MVTFSDGSGNGYRLRLIGPKTRTVGSGVGVVLLASMTFVPIIALLAWVVFMAIPTLRQKPVADAVLPHAT
ncbi:MAG: hypothetical protein M0Z69_15995 [Actinomycetota bacterium]|nr:hypothetical protein [Actinomycetota bacterium]